MKKQFLIFYLIGIVFLSFSFQSLLKTSLEITVRDRLGNTVEGVEVILYKTHPDFQSEENPVSEALKTSKKGKVLFKELESIQYYISAVKGDDNNYGDGEMVDTLVEGRRNKVTLIIR